MYSNIPRQDLILLIHLKQRGLNADIEQLSELRASQRLSGLCLIETYRYENAYCRGNFE
jgi:hypothetical protein